MESVEFKSRAGKKLLKMCMGDLYPNPMVVYREYIQNSCDALTEAERLGYFDNNVRKTVSIQVNGDCITIHDRGTGVRSEDVVSRLIDLSFSQKSGNAIGRYGVGRLTGAKYCDMLTFETSARGETVKSIVRFNARLAREIIATDEEAECTDVIDRVTTYTRESEPNAENHYFRVEMTGVKDTHLLDVPGAIKYLEQTVPVDFTADFKDYVLRTAFESQPDFKTHCEELTMCNVLFNGVNIRKPYAGKVINSAHEDESIGRARYFSIDHEGEQLAWGWYAMTVSAKQFASDVPFRNIRLRQLNMAVGGETCLDNLYYKQVDALYFIGEVYIVHPEIEPTTGRDGLVDNAHKKLFERLLREKFRAMAKEYNTLSKFGSTCVVPLATLIRRQRVLNKNIETGEDNSEIKNEKTETAQAVKEAGTKLTAELTKIRKQQSVADLVADLVDYYQRQADTETEKYNHSKDVQRSGTQIRRVSLATEIDKLMGESENNKPQDTEKPEKAQTAEAETNPNAPTAKPEATQPSELDVYKGMTQLEYSLIRKVYRILNSQKGLPPKVLEKLKAKMSRQLTKR